MPLRDAVEYVAAAYIVAFAIVLIYLTIMSRRLKGVERDLGELTKLADEQLRGGASGGSDAPRDGGSDGLGRDGEERLARQDDGREPRRPESAAPAPNDPSQLDVGRPESTVA